MGIKVLNGFIVLITIMAFSALGYTNYDAFHILVEGLLIGIALSIFIIGWKEKQGIKRGYLTIIGSCYLFVALLSLLHILATLGYNPLLDFSMDSRLIYLWTINDILMSITFLTSAIVYKQIGTSVNKLLTLLVYSLLVVSLIYLLNILPTLFVMGKGFSFFTLIIESINSVVLMITVYLFLTHKVNATTDGIDYLTRGIFFILLSIFSILLVTTKTNILNIVGHTLRIISAFYILKYMKYREYEV